MSQADEIRKALVKLREQCVEYSHESSDPELKWLWKMAAADIVDTIRTLKRIRKLEDV